MSRCFRQFWRFTPDVNHGGLDTLPKLKTDDESQLKCSKKIINTSSCGVSCFFLKRGHVIQMVIPRFQTLELKIPNLGAKLDLKQKHSTAKLEICIFPEDRYVYFYEQ